MKELLSQKFHVRFITRDDAQASVVDLKEAGATPVTANMESAQELEHAFEEADGLVVIVPNTENRVKLARRIAVAMSSNKSIKKVVLISMVGAHVKAEYEAAKAMGEVEEAIKSQSAQTVSGSSKSMGTLSIKGKGNSKSAGSTSSTSTSKDDSGKEITILQIGELMDDFGLNGRLAPSKKNFRIGGHIPKDVRVPYTAAKDIAAVAAQILGGKIGYDSKEKNTFRVVGQGLTMAEIAHKLSRPGMIVTPRPFGLKRKIPKMLYSPNESIAFYENMGWKECEGVQNDDASGVDTRPGNSTPMLFDQWLEWSTYRAAEH